MYCYYSGGVKKPGFKEIIRYLGEPLPGIFGFLKEMRLNEFLKEIQAKYHCVVKIAFRIWAI